VGARRTSATRWSGALAALAAWLPLAACVFHSGGARHPEPPEPVVRIWLPGLVWWSGGRRDLSLEVVNDGQGAVRVEAPAPRRVRVTLFLGSGPDRACGVVPDASKSTGPAVTLGPGEVVPVTVDLSRECAGLPPGEYRYEVAYEAPAVEGGPPVTTRPRHGHVVIEQGASGPEGRPLGSGGDPAR
jgi:hypothetical protein